MFEGLNWGAFLIAMMIIEITPGPNMGWLASLSAQAGRNAGFKAVAGITLGLSLQMFAATLGLTAIVASSTTVYESIRWAGVAFMLYLAWQSWSETAENSPSSGVGMTNFNRGFIANLLNPKALIFYISVVGQFADPQRGDVWIQTLGLGTVHLLVAFIVHIGIVLIGARLGEQLGHWQRSVPVRAAFALSMVGIAIWIAFATAR